MKKQPGPTGKYPRGKISKSDDGQLKIAIGIDEKSNTLIIDFGTPTKWIGLDKKSAEDLAMMLYEKAGILKQD